MDIAASINDVATKHMKHRLIMLTSVRVVNIRCCSLDTIAAVVVAFIGSDDMFDGRCDVISVILTVSGPMETLYDGDERQAVIVDRLRHGCERDCILASD
jgi:hypothetical protein